MLDRKGKQAQWTRARNAEGRYTAQLRAVARQVGMLVRGIAPNGTLQHVDRLIAALNDYAEIIGPWAESVGAYMVADVNRRNEAMWNRNSKDLAKGIRAELRISTPTGALMRDIQTEQVKLIKSIPKAAAERVHELSVRAITNSMRPEEVAKAIMAQENVSKAKADTIARTEVARAAANFVEARAIQAGSEGYIWRTSLDGTVRHSHAEMEGKYVRWSNPPTLDGLTGHAGTLPNCRCYSEPQFPDIL